MMKQVRNIFWSTAIAGILLSAVLPASAGEVNQRQRNQQARIAQGVKSGQLTAGETSHLERKEAGIHREVRNDRAANGGHLTTAERAKVNHQQNVMSRRIYRDKHNARVQ